MCATAIFVVNTVYSGSGNNQALKEHIEKKAVLPILDFENQIAKNSSGQIKETAEVLSNDHASIHKLGEHVSHQVTHMAKGTASLFTDQQKFIEKNTKEIINLKNSISNRGQFNQVQTPLTELTTNTSDTLYENGPDHIVIPSTSTPNEQSPRVAIEALIATGLG